MYKWVNEIVPEAALKKVDVDIGDLISEKGVHYGSGIAYICAKVENEDGEKQNYDFVVKYGIQDEGVRETLRIDVLFEREIEVYTKLLPKFHQLETEKDLEPIDFLPKCYKTEVTDNQEVMILEDLRKGGYILRPKQKPMNLKHIKLVLGCYAKWHALSFALKDQKKEEYQEIVGAWSKNNPYRNLIQCHIGDWINIAHKVLFGIIEETGEIELLNKYKDKIRDLDPKTYFVNLFNRDIEQSVIIHGDCSCCNYMFKYNECDIDQERPTAVKILDYQASHLGSPVFDLSFFIYLVSTETQLEFLRELLENYYTAFAAHLLKLGSDPKKLFTFADLVQHWEKYSAIGALFHPFCLALAHSSEEQAPDVGKKNDFRKCLEVTKTEEFRDRALAVARCFVDFAFI